jgi:uncharacterized membrane protein
LGHREVTAQQMRQKRGAQLMEYFCALLIGVVAGLRTMTALAAVSWAARFRYLELDGTWLSILGRAYTPWILSVLAVGELIVDQLPATPSRKAPPLFVGRIISGALCGAAVGTRVDQWVLGMMLGGAGAILGTLIGAAARQRMADAFHKDAPAALIEDAVAIGSATVLMAVLA